jgi:multiple sugar transport system permease protein
MTLTPTQDLRREPQDGTQGARRRRMTRGASDRLTMSAMVLPSLVLLILVNVYPIGVGISQSLHSGSLLGSGEYVGLANFQDVLTDPGFWRAARFTLVFTVVGTFGSWIVGLAFALALRTNIPGRSVFKVLLMLPWVVPIVVSTTSWQWLTATQESPLPSFLRSIGLGEQLFLADPLLAQITVCVYKVWISFPFMMLLIGAALEGVDNNLYEAARMDGSSRLQMFRYITLPMIQRSTYVGWILMAIFCVNDFPTIYLLTGGGPVDSTQTLMVLAYQAVFESFDTGFGVSIALLMTGVLIAVSVWLFRRLREAVKA